MKKTALVLLVVVLTVCYGQAELDAEYGRAQLRGLEAVCVVVDVAGEGNRGGLGDVLLKTQAANSLRKAGLAVSDTSVDGLISVRVCVLGIDVIGFVYWMEADLNQMARLYRNPAIPGFATLGFGHEIGTAPDSKQLAEVISRNLDRHLDKFLIAYFLANKQE